jgi:small subunit ribosomal protein S21|tara:strand:+ start:1319 stop:1558 length:240 start_codon:yes stop_codon:yes gene_type:complete
MGRRTPVHVEIRIRDQEQVERMIKKFSRKVKKCGILEEVRERRYFTKPSAKRRMKKLEKQRLIKTANAKAKKLLENEYK